MASWGFGIRQRWGDENGAVPTPSKLFITDERCYHPDIVWNWIIKTQDLACGCWLLALCSFALHCSPTHVALFFARSGPSWPTYSMSACLWFELQECGPVFRKHPQTGSWNFEIWFIPHYVSNVKKYQRKKLDIVLELVGGGSFIRGAYPV